MPRETALSRGEEMGLCCVAPSLWLDLAICSPIPKRVSGYLPDYTDLFV